MVTLRLAVPVLIAALAVVATADASLPDTSRTTILPGKAVAGVPLGTSRAVTIRRWGPPSECVTNAAGPGTRLCTWAARPGRGAARVTVIFRAGKAHEIQVVAGRGDGPLRSWRTPEGIGLRSTADAVVAAYPEDPVQTPGMIILPGGPGNQTTFFTLVRGRVSQIQVGNPAAR